MVEDYSHKGEPIISAPGDTRPASLDTQLEDLESRFIAALQATDSVAAAEELRVTFLGRSGELTVVRRAIGSLPAAEKPAAGKRINDAATKLEGLLEARLAELALALLDAELETSIDVTFPGPELAIGSLHPLRQTADAITGYFERSGFAIISGLEIESEYYNFDALNIPADHPAREGFDSFYLDAGNVLRTHTSPMQIRAMQTHGAPIALVVPGRVYRRDSIDARHSFMFHQVEGLMVAPGIHMGHLKGALTGMCRALFGKEQAVRFRPSFFPFTEPSAEVDTTCPGCGGSGCRTCSGTGWIEIGGAGMVHPNVLREVGYDPGQVSGWAFGLGIERVAMVRHGIDDIRAFYENERDFLEQLA